MTNRCSICEDPIPQGFEFCVACAEAVQFSDDEEEAEIGVATNAKLTEGFRLLKGQGE